jgi:hypothetical protein
MRTRLERWHSKVAAFASKLASSQFGLRANLVADQFESGLHFLRSEDGEVQNIRGVHDLFKPQGRERAMKKALLLPALVLLLASTRVWGKKNPPRPFLLRDVVILNGAQVPAGTYELTWETHGSTARATLRKDGQFVATAPGAWVKNGVKYTEDEALLRVNSDGTKSLIEIRIAGAPRAIVFNDTDVTVHYSAKQP